MSEAFSIRRIEIDCGQVPHFSEYFGQWAMLESAFRGLVDTAFAINLPVHLQSQAAVDARSRSSREPAARQQEIAVLSISGPLMKHRSSMGGGTSTVEARRELRALMRDPSVAAIVLQIDSPGGTVAGTMDLAQDIAAAAKQKPVIAYIEDLGASAAYWLASQATEVHANASALVGSIGTYGVVHDLSKAAEKAGVLVHVVRAGEFKGAGAPGTEITESQLAELQRTVNALNDHFLEGVAAGRRLTREQVTQLADGRVHVAAAAKSLQLIDAVSDFDAVLSRAAELSENGPQASSGSSISMTGGQTMSESTTVADGPKHATIDEIEQACSGAPADFVLAQFKKGATIEQSQQAWLQAQLTAANEQNAKLAAELEESKKAAAKPAATPATAAKSGVQPVSHSSNACPSGSAKDQWTAAYAAELKACGNPVQAIKAVEQLHPGLRQQMLEEDNAA